jgi:hypothetical protein
MTVRTATCACGQLRVACSGEPLRVAVCHCLDCQKRTGGPFGAGAFFARKDVAADGASKTFRRGSASGATVSFHFCPDCGSTVFWETERRPDMFGVGIGSFADPAFPAPSLSVFDERRHAWVPLLGTT